VLKNGYTRQRTADHLGGSLSAISRCVRYLADGFLAQKPQAWTDTSFGSW